MAKDILLFLDGTRNRSSHRWAGVDTNVWKLFDAVVDKNLHGGPEARYVRGIASTKAPTPLSGLAKSAPSKESKLAALKRTVHDLVRAGRYVPNNLESATGWGLAQQIQRAYGYLCQHYEYGDRVSLFGFSRGAFAARSLAGFVDQVGLLLSDAARGKHRRYLVTLAYELYRTGKYEQWVELRQFLTEMTGASMPVPGGEGPQSTILPIYFIGVWDTVDALGLEGIGKDNRRVPLLRSHTLHHVAQDVPSNVTHARHAVALHELREPFEPVPWNGSPKVLKQMWFAGAHADVGGGYKDTGHAVHALDWMATEFMEALREGSSPLKLKGLAAPTSHWPTLPPHHEIQGYFEKADPTVRTALVNFRTLASKTQPRLSLHRSAVMRLLDSEAIDYGPYPYETYAPHLRAFPDKVKQALWKVDDLTVQMHLAHVVASAAPTASGGASSTVLDSPAAASGNWATARTQVALRNANALVTHLVPTMRWDATGEAKLADAIVLLAVFDRCDIVEGALRRIRKRAAGWERLARDRRHQSRRLWVLACERRVSLDALMTRVKGLAPGGCLAGLHSVKETLDAVSKASSSFPPLAKPMKKLQPLPHRGPQPPESGGPPPGPPPS